MATEIDWGRKLFGKPRSETRTSSSLRRGVTVGSSEDGYVSVLLDGSDVPVTLACGGKYEAGQTVMVMADGGMYGIMGEGSGSASTGGASAVIFESEEGTSDSFDMDDSAANYSCIDIEYTDGSRYMTHRVYDPNGKSVALSRAVWDDAEGFYYDNSTVVAFDDTRVTQTNKGRLYGENGGTVYAGADATLKITRIIGLHSSLVSDIPTMENIEQIEEELDDKVDGAYVEGGYLYLTSNNVIVAGPLGPFSGTGGGSGGNDAALTLTNEAGWLAKSIAHGASCVIAFSWSSIEGGLATGDGILKVTVDGATKLTRNTSQGSDSVDVGPYLSAGSNIVKVSVSDVYGDTRTINYTIAAVSVSISSTFDATVAYEGDIAFTYTPVGNAEKSVQFELDGESIGSETVTTSGRQRTFVIPAPGHGAHTFEAWFTAEVDGTTIESNRLYYELICVQDSSSAVIIASSFNRTTAEQYETLSVPYIVYDPSSMTADVTLTANGSTTELTVDRTVHTWAYRASEAGSLALEIASGGTVKTITLEVAESSIGVEAETADLALHLTSYGRSNDESDPSTWTSGDVSATLTGFNYASDGWVSDADGITVLRVSGDARVEIPYQAFATDFRGTGKTIEVEFATRDVMDYDAVIFSCMSENRGIQLTAQKAVMKSEQSEISTQYKEDEHVRLSFVVEKRTGNRLVSCYINGIQSGVLQYPEDDDFSQVSPVGISIGSNDCAIDLYCIRVYDNDLTRYQVLDNWIADTQDLSLMLERYERNAVFDAYGQIVIADLPKDLPYLVIEGASLPTYKGDKKTVAGYYVDPVNSSKSFTFENAQIDVQGTSSQYYARKNYKVKFNGGFVTDGTASPTYQMRDGSMPTDTFCFKADVASSEGANNVELARLYDEANPYRTPPQVEDERVRQGIDGFPIVIFHDDGTNVTFIGKYNFNNDKGTPEVFGFTSDDESWEILNNTSNRVLWKSADFSGTDWLNDFEARHPEDNTDATRLQAFAEWLVSTDREQATGEAIEAVTYDEVEHTADTAEYRLAKFKAEFADYVEVDGMLFNYLFTELFLMVDNRAKNAFPTFYDGGKWTILPYDFDTAIGTNNEGALVFSYELEDIDQTSTGADVFNGQASVLYVNMRAAFYEELKAMYQTLRSDGKLSYDLVESRFEEHQAKWPEAIFNEDSWYKYLQPLVEDNSAAYLSMLQGSKAEQRKWWLYNRFRYIDSKYNAGDALSDVITVRGYAKDGISVTPYADIYATIKFGSYLLQQRATRGGSYYFDCPLDNVNDTEIYIYSASQLADVGDLSGLMVGYAEFSMATKLQSLKLGDSSSDYSNANLTELYLGNNTLLRTLDVRNCPNLGLGEKQQAVDISGCTNIEHVYFDGTSITGLTLPNGGILKTLHLPATVTNLTIRNQQALVDFSMPSYENVTTLRIENASAVNAYPIVTAMPANSRVRLVGFDWEFDTAEDVIRFYDALDMMRGLDEGGNNTDDAQVSGRIHVGLVSAADLADIEGRYPDVAVTYDSIKNVVRYYTWDGASMIYAEYVDAGASGTLTTAPSRAATAQYTFSFAGWSTQMDASAAEAGVLENITSDKTVYAAYSRTVRTYTVSFYNESTLLQSVTVEYGSAASYAGNAPTKQGVDNPDDYLFAGWSPDVSFVTGTTSTYAQFVYDVSITRKLLAGTLVEIDNDFASVVGDYAFASCGLVERARLSNATSVGAYAFSGCDRGETIDLPSVAAVGSYAFRYCRILTALILRSETMATLSNTNAFTSTPINSGTGYIYVPSALVASYQAATNWTRYSTQFRALEDYTVDGTITGELDPTKI